MTTHWEQDGSSPFGGILTDESVSATVFTVTVLGGTPVMEKRVRAFVAVPAGVRPALTMYCVVVGLRDWTGWSEI